MVLSDVCFILLFSSCLIKKVRIWQINPSHLEIWELWWQFMGIIVELKWRIHNLMDVGSELGESVMKLYVCLISSYICFSDIKEQIVCFPYFCYYLRTILAEGLIWNSFSASQGMGKVCVHFPPTCCCSCFQKQLWFWYNIGSTWTF